MAGLSATRRLDTHIHVEGGRLCFWSEMCFDARCSACRYNNLGDAREQTRYGIMSMRDSMGSVLASQELERFLCHSVRIGTIWRFWA